MTSIGDQIINEVIKSSLVRAEIINDSVLFTWQGNAAEQLEALVESKYDHKPMPRSRETIAKKILAALDRKDLLKNMTAKELINCTLNCDAVNHDCVIELMDRVLPGWEEE